MGVEALLPLATGAIGGMVGQAVLGPMIGSALGGVLPSLTEGIPAAVSAGTDLAMGGAGSLAEATGLFGIPSSTIGKQAGGLLGSVGGSLAGGALGKAVAPVGMPIPATPGAVPMPSHKGIETPQFQFQTVGPSPSAVIGSRGGGDITELLRRFAR